MRRLGNALRPRGVAKAAQLLEAILFVPWSDAAHSIHPSARADDANDQTALWKSLLMSMIIIDIY